LTASSTCFKLHAQRHAQVHIRSPRQSTPVRRKTRWACLRPPLGSTAILGWVHFAPPLTPSTSPVDSFRSTGPVWSLVIGIWLLFVSCAGIFTPPASRMAKPIGISWSLAFWPAEGLRLVPTKTSHAQPEPDQLQLDPRQGPHSEPGGHVTASGIVQQCREPGVSPFFKGRVEKRDFLRGRPPNESLSNRPSSASTRLRENGTLCWTQNG